MSDLRPRGIPVVINGEERHLLFTLNAIDKVQSKYGKDASEVLDQIAGEYPEGRTMLEVLRILTEDEAEREKAADPESALKPVDEKALGWYIGADNYFDVMRTIYAAYGISLPEPDRNPKGEGGQQSS